MIREQQTLRARQKLVSNLPISGELLRGSLLDRTVRHTKDCPKCARGEGHQVFVLTVTYPGGRTRQISVRREGVAEARRWLANYQDLKEAIEAICELNHDLLRPERAVRKARSDGMSTDCVRSLAACVSCSLSFGHGWEHENERRMGACPTCLTSHTLSATNRRIQNENAGAAPAGNLLPPCAPRWDR
jgi:hypothetical protein